MSTWTVSCVFEDDVRNARVDKARKLRGDILGGRVGFNLVEKALALHLEGSNLIPWTHLKSQSWWHILVIPVLWRGRQEKPLLISETLS